MTGNEDMNLKPACLNIRHKMMYCDERHARTGVVDDSSDTRIFVCIKTQESLGPDGEPVAPARCRRSRSCYSPAP